MNSRKQGRLYIRKRTLLILTALVMLTCAVVLTQVFIIPIIAG